MAEGFAHDLPPINPSVSDDDAGSDSGVESIAATTSSSPTRGAAKMAKGEIPKLTYFFKKTAITEEDRKGYHNRDWLRNNLISFIPEVNVPTVHGSTILCFESYLIGELGLPPSKIFTTITYFLGCELIHFNPNDIAALSCFIMLCECWLGIAPDTSLLWHFYSLAHYKKTGELDYRCVDTTGMSTLTLPSKNAGRMHNRNGS
jgi:hypothetical protein